MPRDLGSDFFAKAQETWKSIKENKPKANKQPMKLMSNMKKIAKLKLGKEKLDLMEGSIFGSLSSVSNERESSAELVSAFCKLYDSYEHVFKLNDKTSFSFCWKEVANVLGMKNGDVRYKDYKKECQGSSAFTDFVYKLRTEFPDFPIKSSKASDLKKVLNDMNVDNEDRKHMFKQMMTFFLFEEVLLCGADNKLRHETWSLVTDHIECERVKWPEVIYDHLVSSIKDAKDWLEKGGVGQHAFKGAAPVFEAIIFERIQKVRPGVWKEKALPVERYITQRLWPGLEDALSNLDSVDISPCPHCSASSDRHLEDSHRREGHVAEEPSDSSTGAVNQKKPAQKRPATGAVNQKKPAKSAALTSRKSPINTRSRNAQK